MNFTMTPYSINYILEKQPEPQTLSKIPSIRPEMIDTIVEAKVEQEMEFYKDQEQAFVEQCLQINPVEYTSRPSSRSKPEITDPVKLQKNDACRRSRINGKIKKAKLTYQNQFLAIKMQQRAAQLDVLKQMIANAEMNLLKSGHSLSELKKLRTMTGMDKVQASKPSLFKN